MTQEEKEAMRFTVVDCRYETPYAGLAEVHGNNGNLMLSVPQPGCKHWYDLELYESTPLTVAHLKVVRVK